MTLSIWRYSHLSLALVAALFILLAALTGGILSLEPVVNRSQNLGNPAGESLPIGKVISTLRSEYLEVLSLTRDDNNFFIAELITEEGELIEVYIDPVTGKKTGELLEQHPVFEFATTLHRSLYMDTVGRFTIGVSSVLLLLITISGTVLVVQRQRSWKSFFSRIERTGFARYTHLFVGRLALIPIFLIALTGSYLFLQRFGILPDSPTPTPHTHAHSDDVTKPLEQLPFFSETSLSEVNAIVFPFSPDEEDYFLVQLSDREVTVHQYNGALLSEAHYPFSALAKNLSLSLHTGRGNSVWSLVLLFASLALLLLIYSGFRITLQRRKGRIANAVNAKDAQIVILYGSETGGTRAMARLLQTALLKTKQSVFVAELNAYQHFSGMQHLIVLTSTYGCGEAPANAKKFVSLFQNAPPKNTYTFSVIGFGSFAYPDFCRFADTVSETLMQQRHALCAVQQVSIHNQSYSRFLQWATDWSAATGIVLDLPLAQPSSQRTQHPFRVVAKTTASYETGENFCLELTPLTSQKFRSGDLIGFYPPNDPLARLYSIGTTANGNIRLLIKRHEQGLCSNYLHNTSDGQELSGFIQKNPDFHFPTRAKKVILIANGTGIAPFMGMLYEKHRTPIDLFWGGRTAASLSLYQQELNAHLASGRLHRFFPAFSRGPERTGYVYDLIREHGAAIAHDMQSGAVIMICGSIAMQHDVITVLNELCIQHLEKPLAYYQQRGRIKMDCY